MGPAAILSVLVDAQTTGAAAKLTKFDAQMEAVRAGARKGIEAQLGANFNPAAFKAYEARLSQASRRAKDRAAFKAELGANFNNQAFNAYERQLSKGEKETRASTRRMGGSFLGLGKNILLAGGAFAAFSAAKNAIETTGQLTYATVKLSAATGFDTKTASSWIESMKVRGVQSNAVAMSFITLARTVRAAEVADASHAASTKKLTTTEVALQQRQALALSQLRARQQQQLATLNASGASHAKVTALLQRQALAVSQLNERQQAQAATAGSVASKTDKANAALGQLGVSQEAIRSGNINEVLLESADGFQKITNPAQRAALAQQLFARNAKVLLPVLAQGRKGVEDMLGAAQRYGAYIDNSQLATFRRAHEAQLALNLATDGLKIAFTQNVLPVLVSGAQKLMTFIQQMRSGQGVGGQFASAIGTAFNTVRTVISSVAGVVGGFGNLIKIMLAAFVASKIFAFTRAVKEFFLLIEDNPVGAFLTVLGLLVGAFMSVNTQQSDAASSAQAVADAWNNARDAARGLQDANLNVTQSNITLVNSRLAVRNAVSAQTQALREFGSKSLQYRQATADLQQADLSRREAQIGATRAVEDARTAQDKKRSSDQLAATALGTSVTVMRRLTDAQSRKIQADQQEVLTLGRQADALKAAHAPAEELRAKQDQLRAVVARLAKEQSGLNNALSNMPKNVSAKVHVTWVFGDAAAALAKSLGLSPMATQHLTSQFPGHATGGMVNRPGYFAGEEAPRHPEIILATNPAYRSRNVGLFRQAGKMLGVPGYAAGGVAGFESQLGSAQTELAGIVSRDARGQGTAGDKDRAVALRAEITKLRVEIRGLRTETNNATKAQKQQTTLLQKLAGYRNGVLIPSQAVGPQIQMTQFANALQAAQNSGNVMRQQSALTGEARVDKSMLTLDRRRLAQVNKALGGRLSKFQHGKLLQDKLAILQDVGNLLGNLGSAQSALESLTSGAGGAGGFDLAPTGASITSPTAYDVRSAMAHGSHVHLHVHAPISVTDAHDGEEIKRIVEDSVDEMGDKIDRHMVSHAHARMRAAGMRGS